MALQAGIVGLPNVGKSTLFNAVSNSAKAQASNYRFCTIEPNVGLVDVPDNRLDQLAELIIPQRIVPTQLEIVDIAGLVKGASKGEGLGNKFLANIREVSAIIHVIRCFEDENVLREEGAINPISDKEIIETELQLKDLDSVEKKMQRSEKMAKTDPKAKAELEVLQRCKGVDDIGTLDAAAIATAFNKSFEWTILGVTQGTDDSLWRAQAEKMKKGNLNDLCNIKNEFDSFEYLVWVYSKSKFDSFYIGSLNHSRYKSHSSNIKPSSFYNIELADQYKKWSYKSFLRK